MAYTLQSADALFPTPLLRFEIEDAETLNRTLLKEIAKRRAAEQGTVKSNRKGWHSDTDLFERTEPAQAQLAKMLIQMLAQATRHVAPNADMSGVELVADGWINVNPPGAYNAPHDHLGAFWSGTYYVNMPEGGGGDERAGAIEFLSPHKPLPGVGSFRAPITADKVHFRPKSGTVLIFPATIVHWVHPNDGKDERVTIAFNARFRRKRGNAILRPAGGAPLRS